MGFFLLSFVVKHRDFHNGWHLKGVVAITIILCIDTTKRSVSKRRPRCSIRVPVFVDGTCKLLAVLLALVNGETMRDRQQIRVHQSRLQLHEQTPDGESGRPENGIEDEESQRRTK